jgi:hypothetical protein
VKPGLLAAVLGVALVALSCGGLNAVIKQPKPVTATTELTSDQGALLFSDNFKDSAAGWSTATVADFSASFTSSGYVMTARNFVDHEVAAPYGEPKEQISVAVTATESPVGSPVGAGFGVGCYRGLKDPTVHYNYAVEIGGTWGLYRHDLRPGAVKVHSLLKKGTAPKPPGASALTAELMCATLADGITTRLVMFIDGAQVADITDPVPDLPHLGWLGAIVVRGEDSGPTTVTATHFEERDLSL